jgi:anti-sigma28 factor (negative regulator of flagellin synthesis)
MNSSRASEKILKQLTRVRLRKIEQLKARIAQGSYRIRNKQIAKAIVLAW